MQFLLFLLIFPSFVLFGIDGYNRMREKGEVVATVNGQDITRFAPHQRAGAGLGRTFQNNRSGLRSACRSDRWACRPGDAHALVSGLPCAGLVRPVIASRAGEMSGRCRG